MKRGIEIHPDMIAGIVPYLQEQTALDQAHETSRHIDPLLHLTHMGLVATVVSHTNYPGEVLDVVDIGAKAYEALIGATTNTEVPDEFGIEALARRGDDPYFAITFGKELEAQREVFLESHPKLAEGILEICVGVLGADKRRTLNLYAIGAAGLMHAAYEQVKFESVIRTILDGKATN